ncbi:thiamine pyrophosphate-binding protein [Geomicrobium sediminis]|uniref:Acetolactate synthase-1/2/3 large subunit n=1 Tax=Geomicrobium sediminis TaxID=1347788 RepID=A0ABS2PG31_9BACL|nr:thiamine pyrophosphate-binding protein [Geomicrobium sediminis]MBM7634380.1 acetolactate synthase-1/2/3 large subunit [Geomicrobium sediminis]
MPKVSEVIAKFVKDLGCHQAFGVPGKPISPLIFAMDDHQVEFILAKHETGAGYMATGYALENETIGVAIGTSGPGGTNLITAAGQAQAFNAPVLFLTGHPPLEESGRALCQDSSSFGADLVNLFRPVTKFSAKVENKQTLKRYLHHAIEQALTGAKGPVHLSIPMDILLEESEYLDVSDAVVQDTLISSNLTEVMSKLENAKRPAILAGKGVHISRAYEELEAFATLCKIPVMTTPGGKGTFKSNHPYSLGSFGLGGSEVSLQYVNEGIDVLVVIGSKLSDMSTAGFRADNEPKTVIQFDLEPTFVGKSLSAKTLFVQGDAKRNLKELLKRQPSAEIDRDLPSYELDVPELPEHTERLAAGRAIEAIRKVLPYETVIYGDDGSHTFYAIKHFEIKQPGTFYFDDVFGAMGHAIGLAIGAKAANRNKPMAVFTGDGCLMMHGTELSTAASEDLPILFFVFNNGMHDMVDKGMKNLIGRSVGSTFKKDMNIADFAISLGCHGHRCYTEDDVAQATKAALTEASTPTVIELMVRQDEVPPTQLRDQMKGLNQHG